LKKVGILRGSGLNAYEGQYLEKLPQHDFQPVGITTYDNKFDLSRLSFPVRTSHTYVTWTKDILHPMLSAVGKLTKYNFNSWNYRIINLHKMIKDLDLIYSADAWYPYTLQAIKTGKPTIVMQWENIPFNLEGHPYKEIKRYNYKHAAYFIAITEKAREALVLEGVEENKISVVPVGLDCKRFKPAKKNRDLMKKFGLSEDSVKILFIGRLVEEKGIHDLLNAFSLLAKKVSNIELLLAGGGEENMLIHLKQMVSSLQIESKVKFLGKIPYENVPEIHNLADVFCYPSIATEKWAEQFGYSMVEAMACEKPVISTFTGSIPEIIKDRETGILVSQKNPSELESALEELIISEQERTQLGQNGRQWVLEQFEADKVAGRLAQIFCRFV